MHKMLPRSFNKAGGCRMLRHPFSETRKSTIGETGKLNQILDADWLKCKKQQDSAHHCPSKSFQKALWWQQHRCQSGTRPSIGPTLPGISFIIAPHWTLEISVERSIDQSIHPTQRWIDRSINQSINESVGERWMNKSVINQSIINQLISMSQ